MGKIREIKIKEDTFKLLKKLNKKINLGRLSEDSIIYVLMERELERMKDLEKLKKKYDKVWVKDFKLENIE